MRKQCLNTHFPRAFRTSYVFLARVYVFVEEKMPSAWKIWKKEYKVFVLNLWKKCLCQSWMFFCWGERRYIGVGSKQIACRVLELLQVQGKTNSSKKTVTLPMKLNQLLWKINPWTSSVSIETTDKSINTLEKEKFSSRQLVSTFHVATLPSAVFHSFFRHFL